MNWDEKLSLFMDGEMTGEESQEVLDRLKTDPELQRKWLHYHMISFSLQKNKEKMKKEEEPQLFPTTVVWNTATPAFTSIPKTHNKPSH